MFIYLHEKGKPFVINTFDIVTVIPLARPDGSTKGSRLKLRSAQTVQVVDIDEQFSFVADLLEAANRSAYWKGRIDNPGKGATA